MKVGTIMELLEREAVLLTEECDFVRIPRFEGMELGQRIPLPEVTKKNTGSILRGSIGLALAACILLAAFGAFRGFEFFSAEAYAFISVDINPSIELAISKDEKIMGASAFNEEGTKVLKNLKIKNESLDQALILVVREAENLGYFKGKKIGAVLLTGTPNEKYAAYDEKKTEIQKELKALIEREEDSIETAEAKKINVAAQLSTPEVRKEAKENKISVGRQQLIETAKANGDPSLTVNEVRKANITNLLKKSGEKVLDSETYKDYQEDKESMGDEDTNEKEPSVTPTSESKNSEKEKDKLEKQAELEKQKLEKQAEAEKKKLEKKDEQEKAKIEKQAELEKKKIEKKAELEKERLEKKTEREKKQKEAEKKKLEREKELEKKKLEQEKTKNENEKKNEKKTP